MSSPEEEKSWRFLSNHTQVLLCLHRDPDARFRDMALHIGITERAVQRIVADLVETGYVESERVGRRNHYKNWPPMCQDAPCFSYREQRTENGDYRDGYVKMENA